MNSFFNTRIRIYGLKKTFTSNQNDKTFYDCEIVLEDHNHHIFKLLLDVKQRYFSEDENITDYNIFTSKTHSNENGGSQTQQRFDSLRPQVKGKALPEESTVQPIQCFNKYVTLFRGYTLHIVHKNFKRFRIMLQNPVNTSYAVCNDLAKTLVVLNKYTNNSYRYGKIEELNWWDGSVKTIAFEKIKQSVYGIKYKPKCDAIQHFNIEIKHLTNMFNLATHL
jgi:hypothetical protein